MTLVGTNVTLATDGKKLTISIDLSAKGVMSTSGKNELVASTHGYVVVAEGVRLNLNVIRK